MASEKMNQHKAMASGKAVPQGKPPAVKGYKCGGKVCKPKAMKKGGKC